MIKIQRIKKYALILFCLTSLNISQSCKKNNKEKDGFSFVFMTDIHLQPEGNAVEGFSKAIETINNLSPEFIITGGDLIFDALSQTEGRADSLYSLYLKTIKDIKIPLYNTLGNHEIFGLSKSSGIDPSHEYYGKKMFLNRIGKKYYAFDHKGWRFYILDSVGETEERGYYGFIDEEQIKWIAEDLAKIDKSIPIVISVHIPFITVQAQLDRGSLAKNGQGLVINNSKEVLDLYKDHNLKLVLQGHLHKLEDMYTRGIHFITGGAVSGSWWNGPYGKTEEGFLLIKTESDQLTWEYIDYGWEVN